MLEFLIRNIFEMVIPLLLNKPFDFVFLKDFEYFALKLIILYLVNIVFLFFHFLETVQNVKRFKLRMYILSMITDGFLSLGFQRVLFVFLIPISSLRHY